MIIGVLSDTHIPKRAKKLPRIVLETFGHVDHIIHAGDVMTMDVINSLEELAPVTAIAGNRTRRRCGKGLGISGS